jgi:hypothetical protein
VIPWLNSSLRHALFTKRHRDRTDEEGSKLGQANAADCEKPIARTARPVSVLAAPLS